MLIRSLLIVSILVVVFVSTMAAVRGRDSRYFHLISAALSPVTELFVATPGESLRPPLREVPDTSANGPWKWFQEELVGRARIGDTPTLHPVRETLWWNNIRGPMAYRYVTGDATISATVRTRSLANPDLPPAMEWQFGGLILRDPRGDALLSTENYVFNVVGFRGKRLQVETKDTRKGLSHVDAWNWPSGDAQLRIERQGSKFIMHARQDDSQPWRHLTAYERPDLPDTLQLGLILYAYSEGRGRHDIQVAFDDLIVH